MIDPTTSDVEMSAMAKCVEGLEPLADKPAALARVLNYLATRYIDGMKEQLKRLDAEIKEANERLAKQKFDKMEADSEIVEPEPLREQNEAIS